MATPTAATPTPFSSIQTRIVAIAPYLSSFVAIGLFITSIVMASQFVGSKDNWNDIQPQIVKVWIFSLIGTLFLCIASYMYFIQNPAHTLMFTLILTCISLGLAYSAVAIAAITR
jgi:hypothetical protein